MKKIDKKFKWDDFSVEKVEKKHDIRLVAKREGLLEEPCSKSLGSITEGEIKQEFDNHVHKNTENLRHYFEDVEKEQNKLSSYLKDNHFQPIVNNLDVSLNASINKKELEEADSHNNYKMYKAEQDQFKKFHQISREANYATKNKTIAAFGLILFLFVVEFSLNGFMLQGALVGGLIEGISVATSVAFLNCIGSALAGYWIFKNVTHLEKNKKILWGFYSFLYTGFVIYLNACLGAYRSESERILQKLISSSSEAQTLSTSQIQETLTKVITPWSSDIEFSFVGMVLTFVGLLFALISIWKGFSYNDTYPGYGDVGKKVNFYKNAIRKINKSFVSDISKMEDISEKELLKTYNNIKKNELNYWDANANLIQKEFINYEQKVDYASRGVNHIIGEYRKENSKIRKSEAPVYFKQNWELSQKQRDPKIVFPDTAFHYMCDEDREAKKLKISEELDTKFQKAQSEIKALIKSAINKQKELHEKYSTY